MALLLYMLLNAPILPISSQKFPLCTSNDSYFEFHGYNAHFNVCPLVLTPHEQLNYYTVEDATNEYEDFDIYYHFNWLDPVLSFPSDLCSTITTGYCNNWTPDYQKCNDFTNMTYKTWIYKEKHDSNGQVIECSHVNGAGINTNVAWRYFGLVYNTNLQQGLDPSAGHKKLSLY